MKKFLPVILLVALAWPAASMAMDVCGEAGKQFAEAVDVYKKQGGAAFMSRVLRNGPFENDKRSLTQVQSLGQIEQFFGKLQSSSVLSSKALGEKTCYLIGVLEYESGPAFTVATYYQGVNGVGATSMFFKTEPETIFPSDVLVPE